jgi:hypothetical protein
MATAATLVLKNSADVNVNYFPVRIITGQEAGYVDRTQGVLALQPKASLFYRENLTTRIVTGKVTYPVLNATTGVLDSGIATFDMRLPFVLDLTSRQEVRKRLASLVADPIVTAAVDNGETPW